MKLCRNPTHRSFSVCHRHVIFHLPSRQPNRDKTKTYCCARQKSTPQRAAAASQTTWLQIFHTLRIATPLLLKAGVWFTLVIAGRKDSHGVGSLTGVETETVPVDTARQGRKKQRSKEKNNHSTARAGYNSPRGEEKGVYKPRALAHVPSSFFFALTALSFVPWVPCPVDRPMRCNLASSFRADTAQPHSTDAIKKKKKTPQVAGSHCRTFRDCPAHLALLQPF